MRRPSGVAFVFLCLVLFPAIGSAQATLTGTVRDTSGAVLPGVTVEAASPALIEKLRTAVTDGSGQYRITELQPGTYSITFSLAGFTSVKREGITVLGSGAIAVNIELSVGTLAETVTVSGEAPLVDTQTTRRETVVNSETLSTLPITRSYGAVLYAVPGLTVQPGVGGNDLVPSMATFSAHGGNSTEGRMLVNGLPVAGPFSNNSVAQFGYDLANADELQVLVSGGLGEAETGGPLVNLLPKSGGNRYTGAGFYSGTTSRFQSDNVDDELRAIGITRPPAIRQNFDASGSLGGPIKRDRIWFYGSLRSFGLAQVIEGVSPNLYALDATKWIYAPEPGVEVRRAETKTDISLRFTGQVSARNRVSFSHQYQDRCLGSSLTVDGEACRTRQPGWIAMGTTAGAPEAQAGYGDDPTILTQATWTSTLSSRLLVDTALSRFAYGIVGNGQMPSDANLGLIGVTELSAIYGRANWSYRAPFTFAKYDTVPWGWRGALSYVTGSHSAKFGYQGALQKYDWHTFVNSNQMRYIFNNGVPIGVNYYVAPSFNFSNRTETHALYVQDQWTRGRLTVQGALRYDRVTSWAPAEGNGTEETSIFNPQPIRFDRTVSVRGYNDINPRMGVAYDVFGNGKTAVKVNAGRYLSAATADGIYSANSPALKLVTQLSGNNGRGWTDGNKNYRVDCNLASPALQDNLASGGDLCAALTGNNLNFGSLNPSVTTIDPEILGGWGVRPSNWQFGASVQHEVLPRVSVDVGYNRRWWGNHFVTINTLVGPNDFDSFTVPIPSNAKLPDDVGTSAPFVSIKPEASARGAQNLQTKETNFAPARTTYWHGFDYSANARMANGLTLQGGASTGRGIRNTCELWTARPDLQQVIPALSTTPTPQRSDACDVVEPWMTTVRGLASYRLPKVDVLVSTIVRSARTTASGDVASNGTSLAANYQLPNTELVKYLGRLPAGALPTGTTTLNILTPSMLYPPERQNQMDLRVAKILRFGRTRYDLGIDLYNLFNANTATAFQQTYVFNNSGSTWLNPTSIMSPRLLRFNVTATF